MNEKEIIVEGKKNNKKVLFVVIGILVLIGVALGVSYYFKNNKETPVDNQKTTDNKDNKTEEKHKEEEYIQLSDNIKVLRADYKLSSSAKINSTKTDTSNGLVFVDVVEPEFQFITHYLLCFDNAGKLLLDIRTLKDKDNDNNSYKYNGKFEYDNNKKVLTFNTNLFLGESDESTGNAFNDKGLSELTSAEKKILGNYSDEVKYTYKYENKKLVFSEKKEISKLKDNDYYKYELNN